ncbi:methyltransferase [Rhizobiales bacterium RZME27]|uniref:Methyltransferase n=1 Tax=Endobacterium cereale TaxID=2663029 RepID=A0A6A8AI63_9HYPH|nr:50S ribosomal protein L11 methyltransferase [Endobacterium cereale]MEB2845445.1 50S ribosomal protein L11 methyltransferase [Endobacterium cereale]MQY48926.1 methyltransferase [Endobacterium cereale]
MNVSPEEFIRSNLRVEPARLLPEISLYTAHPGSRLSQLMDDAGEPPYWAYAWAGGTVLARYLLDQPEVMRGRRVLDLGCGSGVVGIAAAKAGAARVTASDIDAIALAATRLNASLNDVKIDIADGNLIGGSLPFIDIVLVGDLFYDKVTAARVLPWLSACRAEGKTILIGDPFRAHLPQDSLQLVASYDVPDFGSGSGRAGVFSLP